MSGYELREAQRKSVWSFFFWPFMTRRLVLEFDILELGPSFMNYMFFKARVYADPSPLSA